MFENRVALVTGGTRGIGLAVAKELARCGVEVAITATAATAEEAVAAIQSLGVRCRYYRCDVSSVSQTEETVKAVIADFGRIDILINNAGITADKLLIAMTEEEFSKVLSVNLVGAFHMIKSCMRHFLRNRYARIVNMASVVGLMGNAGQANYAASKAGLIGLTKSIAREYAAKGITCNAVAPGFIATDMTAKLGESYRQTVEKSIPVGRFGSVEDVARTVCFLADDGSGYITGETIRVDGGIYI